MPSTPSWTSTRSPLRRTERLARQLIEAHGLSARLEPTTERKEALAGADFVVVCFQVGGRDAYAVDMEIPRRYGVDQTVGDTLGPGGVFRGLRSMKALEEITRDMHELCPDALLLNYANPMAVNCWFASGQGIRTTGLCHSVQHTADELASIMGLEDGTWSFRAAGINHQAWMLEFRHRGRDVLPELRAAVNAYHRGELTPGRPLDEWYAGGREGVRTAVMNLTGYFQTESSHHASEYYPHFRRTPADVAALLPQRWDYLEITRGNNEADLERMAKQFADGTLAVSEEYAARIVDSVVTNTPRVGLRQRPEHRPDHQPARAGAASRCPASSTRMACSRPGWATSRRSAPGSTSRRWATRCAWSTPSGRGRGSSSTPRSPWTGSRAHC